MPSLPESLAEGRQLLYTLSPKPQSHPMERSEHVVDQMPEAFSGCHLLMIYKTQEVNLVELKTVKQFWFMDVNKCVEIYNFFIRYLSTWDLQNGRFEFNSIIRCIPMSLINTADSTTTNNAHIKVIVLARKLDIWNRNWIQKKKKRHTLFVIHNSNNNKKNHQIHWPDKMFVS